MVLKGEQPPRDLPTAAELDRFSRAYAAIGELEGRGIGEGRQVERIEAEGLSRERYNRIAELVESHPSIRAGVADRLGH